VSRNDWFGKYSTIVDGEEVKKQRYRCKGCRMTFTDLTNTSLYRTRRLNKWIKFIDKAIGHKLSNENVLCTDSWRAFKIYAAEKGLDI
jgi:transposase-like protein